MVKLVTLFLLLVLAACYIFSIVDSSCLNKGQDVSNNSYNFIIDYQKVTIRFIDYQIL